MQNILVIDDVASLRGAVEKYLKQQGFAVVAAGSAFSLCLPLMKSG